MSSSFNPKPKAAKKKVLLMGKSGSGKTSMRSIIFSNFVAKDVRRLGATIDVEHSQIKFLGNLILNLWDCGGQDAFTETYLTTQRASLFRDVGVLIYVFDIESRSLAPPSSSPDLATYESIITALAQYSPGAFVFVLLHKMDLINPPSREMMIRERGSTIRGLSGPFRTTMNVYGTSIWDQSLYEAWGDIVRRLIPDLGVLQRTIEGIGRSVDAEECILFERATFLTVSRVGGERAERNPYDDRLQNLSNLLKTFRHSLQSYTAYPSSSSSSPPFTEFLIKAPRFNLCLASLTLNTYVLVVLPPGEMDMNAVRSNICVAKQLLAGDVGEDYAESQSGGESDFSRTKANGTLLSHEFDHNSG